MSISNIPKTVYHTLHYEMSRMIKSYSCFVVKRFYETLSSVKPGCLMGIGNPLLDYLFYVKPLTYDKYIKKFKLKKNHPQMINLDQNRLFSSVRKCHSKGETLIINVGGGVQNSIRVSQWILNVPEATTYFGAVGVDDEAIFLKEKLKEQNVHICYQSCDGLRTGKCLIMFSGKERTMVSDMGASSCLTADMLFDSDVRQRFEMARYIYLEGFLWMTNPSVMTELIAKISTCDKIVATNIHAEYLAPYFTQAAIDVLENIDILFGNQFEALALAKSLAIAGKVKSFREKFTEFLNFPMISTDALSRIALYIGKLNRRRSDIPRIIVFTQGDNEIVLCVNDYVTVIPVSRVIDKDIIDATGCGDAFVGGFLSGIIMGNRPEDAVKMGIVASQYILTQNGCYIPPKMKFDEVIISTK